MSSAATGASSSRSRNGPSAQPIGGAAAGPCGAWTGRYITKPGSGGPPASCASCSLPVNASAPEAMDCSIAARAVGTVSTSRPSVLRLPRVAGSMNRMGAYAWRCPGGRRTRPEASKAAAAAWRGAAPPGRWATKPTPCRPGTVRCSASDATKARNSAASTPSEPSKKPLTPRNTSSNARNWVSTSATALSASWVTSAFRACCASLWRCCRYSQGTSASATLVSPAASAGRSHMAVPATAGCGAVRRSGTEGLGLVMLPAPESPLHGTGGSCYRAICIIDVRIIQNIRANHAQLGRRGAPVSRAPRPRVGSRRSRSAGRGPRSARTARVSWPRGSRTSPP